MEQHNVTDWDAFLRLTKDYANPQCLFRGQGRDYGSLLPKIGRPGAIRAPLATEPKYDREYEIGILEQFKEFAYPFVDKIPGNDWYWLALAQHHGLPTRLLDFTNNPWSLRILQSVSSVEQNPTGSQKNRVMFM